jgi:hypothetical protein
MSDDRIRMVKIVWRAAHGLGAAALLALAAVIFLTLPARAYGLPVDTRVLHMDAMRFVGEPFVLSPLSGLEGISVIHTLFRAGPMSARPMPLQPHPSIEDQHQ